MDYIDLPIITVKEANQIIDAVDKGLEFVDISLDLGITKYTVKISGEEIIFKDDILFLEDIKGIKEDFCYVIEESELKKLGFFSDETQFYYKLFPTRDWPTMMFSSTPMHRYSKISPREDTLSKIKNIQPIKGKVLDTCCGLGYTAIMASSYATAVYTHECDDNVVYLEAINPYSRKLFTEKKIKHIFGNIYDIITDYEDDFFDIIIHDPPTPKYSPELYSDEFYHELLRVLKSGGYMYHYAPAPHKTKGEEFYKRLEMRLIRAGFSEVIYHASSSGIVAKKK